MFSISPVYNLINICLIRNNRLGKKEMSRHQYHLKWHQQKQHVRRRVKKRKTQRRKRYGNCLSSFSDRYTIHVRILQEKRKMNDKTENEPPRKRQRKQVHEEVEEISGDADDGDFQVEPLKSVMFSISLVYNLITIYLIRNNRKKEMSRRQQAQHHLKWHQQKQHIRWVKKRKKQRRKRYGNCFSSFSDRYTLFYRRNEE
jgi:hypothetical protein